MKPPLGLGAALLLALATLGTATRYSSAVFKYQCPESCLCVPDVLDVELLIISCKWPQLRPEYLDKFPRNATKSLSIHCTQNGSVSELGTNVFVGFSELKELRVSECQFNDLASRTFAGLDALKVLYLSGYAQPQLATDLFEPIRSVDKLSMTNGRLKALPDRVLCPLKTVQILSLAGNRLSDARLGLTDEDCLLEQLILLDLSRNAVRRLDAGDLRAYPALRQLGLAANALDELAADLFASNALLQHLDLESNLLRTAPQLPESLLYLNLADNRLETIPVTVANLEQLDTLNVSRNDVDHRTPFRLYSAVLQTLDLSHNRFRAVPTALFERSVDTLKALRLANNRLDELEPGAFANYSRLQTLDLSENGLKSLPEGAFEGLAELVELRLTNNSIYHVDVEAFRPLGPRLQYLNMARNQLIELPMAVARLTEARQLDFSENSISKTYKFILNKMPHLARLDLAANQLSAVDPYVFTDCAQLHELSLRANRLSRLSADAFARSGMLRTLDLSRNAALASLDGALRAVHSLRHLNLSGCGFRLLDWAELPAELAQLGLAANRLELLGAAGASRVRRLDLAHNALAVLLADQLPAGLEWLGLAHNRLQHLSNQTFARQPQLRLLDLRANRLRSFSQQSLPAAGQLRLRLADNPLRCDCRTGWLRHAAPAAPVHLLDWDRLHCETGDAGRDAADADNPPPHPPRHRQPPQREQHEQQAEEREPLPPGHKWLWQTRPEDFVCAYEEVCEPNCVCCQFSSCDCKSRCPRGCHCFHDADFRTNIVRCDANQSAAPMQIEVRELPMHATHIHLNGVQLHTLKSRDLTGRAHLQDLRINNTGLREIQKMALNTLPSLKTLVLTHNRLQRVEGVEAVKTGRVQRLDLGHNRLVAVDARLATMFPALQELGLAGNALTRLPAALDACASLRRVWLGANPFGCDCRAAAPDFAAQAWVAAHGARLVADLAAVLCAENVTRAFRRNETRALSAQAPNRGDDLFVMRMVDFLRQANATFCARRAPDGLFGGGPVRGALLTLLAAAFACTAAAALLHLACGALRRRARRRPYEKAPPSMNSSTLTPAGLSPHPPLLHYDLFLSYAKKDEQFVRERLVSTLQANDYSLCLLHEEAAAPRADAYSSRHQRVSDELNRQMGASRTLLLVLTPHFLANEWSTLQVKTSHQLFSAGQRQRADDAAAAAAAASPRRVVVLVDEAVDANRVDNELGQMMRHNTCIPMQHQLFWPLLMQALPRRARPPAAAAADLYAPDDRASDTTQVYSDMYGTIVPSEIV